MYRGTQLAGLRQRLPGGGGPLFGLLEEPGDQPVLDQAEVASPHRQRPVAGQPLRAGAAGAVPAGPGVAELQRGVAAGVQRQPDAPDPYRVGGQRRFVERRVGDQHLLVHVAQGGAGGDAQLRVQGEAGGAVQVEGLRLPAGPVQRRRQGRHQAFAQRVPLDQRAQFGGQRPAVGPYPAGGAGVAVEAGVQPVLGALLQRTEPQFGQLRAEPGAEFAVREPVEEFAAPQGEGLLGTAQPLGGVAQGGGCAGALGELGGVHAPVAGLDGVAVAAVGDAHPVRPEHGPQPADVRVQGAASAVAPAAATAVPQQVRQPVRRHDAPRGGQQHRQQQPLLAPPAERGGGAVAYRLEGAEQAELQHEGSVRSR
ncbi:hypothetical protein GCM10009802_22880 [Streptomyces synnematoformans]|uniref:Uncharacterized protein n=1 Tax=Streptomyces synnematoformans TaxID=415721 RepID=A0ABN2Y1I1_9ACTN